ncbi:hypothetical protein [Edaphobacter modestus]|uniref:Uncharacterized protein n=1 Tax=Edaphobacter modestus TaxID=388466 RepID=A0A4Q7YZX2_9BACT|nr:hypothetical protein [Edaphobacter modestus]RZU42793.1 hypothetical protein BDD14_4389 [Edaphobacter modestus]
MRRHLQLGAVFLLIFVTSGIRAQLQLKHDKPKAEDLSWMWQYTQPADGGNGSGLLNDVRLKALLQAHFTAPQTFWSNGKSLPETIFEFLGQSRSVVADDNRYFVATGCVAQFCPNRGLLWIDVGSAHPLFVFAATNWIAESKATDQAGSTYTLWVFASRALDPAHLPQPLTRSIAPWATEPLADNTVEQIANVILVDPDGQPHPIQPADLGIGQTKKQTEQKANS